MNKITTFNYVSLNQEEKELKSLLFEPKKQFFPKQSTINVLLNYSKSLNVRKSKYINAVEMVLN